MSKQAEPYKNENIEEQLKEIDNNMVINEEGNIVLTHEDYIFLMEKTELADGLERTLDAIGDLSKGINRHIKTTLKEKKNA